MFGNKKKIDELKSQHDAEIKTLKEKLEKELEAKIAELSATHETQLAELGAKKDDETDIKVTEELAAQKALVQSLVSQVKSMGEQLNISESIPKLIDDELKKHGIENFNIDDIKEQLLKDAQVKSEEQQIQEEAAQAEFNDEYDKALENLDV